MENEGFSLQDLTGLVRRRARLVGLTFVAIVISSIVIAYSLENLYRSSGTIMIEHGEISDKYLPGTYRDTNPEQRIERIYAEVMTKENLSTVVENHNLYLEARDGGPPESVVSELRKNLELEFRLSGEDPRSRDAGNVTGFIISYFHADPEMARNVARDMIALFQEENRERRQAAYLETAAALERESDGLRTQVTEYEEQLAGFKSEHPGALPEDRNYNRQIVDRKARDLDDLDREIRSLQERKTLLQSQLAQTEPWVTMLGADGQPLPTSNEQLRLKQADYLRLLGIYNSSHPDVLRAKREVDALMGGSSGPAARQTLETQLATTRSELDLAQRAYAEGHPDRRKLERAVAELEKQIAELPSASADVLPPNNPIYINLEVQLQGADNELVALQKDQTSMRYETRELDRKIQVAPDVERRYLALTRDLGLARKQYEDSKSRLMSVQRAGVLEEEELAERYIVTRYPSLPYEPAFPNRPLFLVIGVILGLTIGLLVGLVTEALDGTIRSTRDIRNILGMSPIAAIPEIITSGDITRARTSRFAYVLTMSVIVIFAAIYVYIQGGGSM